MASAVASTAAARACCITPRIPSSFSAAIARVKAGKAAASRDFNTASAALRRTTGSGLNSVSPPLAASIPQVPGSLGEVLDALEADHDFLLEGGVFTPDLIETWIAYKRLNEIDPIRMRPHPHEFELYYDI